MIKEEALRKILDQLDILDYLVDSADILKIGNFQIYTNGYMWIVKDEIDGWASFHTRMAAIGSAKCMSSGDFGKALEIRNLDNDVANLATHVDSIALAARSNQTIEAKLSEAGYRHREKMQDLADLIINIL